MDKLNLIEKLKTLKQWQLEQKLDFENLKSEYGSINTQTQQTTQVNEENKENADLLSENQMKYKLSQKMFMNRIPPNILSQALKQANISIETAQSPTNLSSNITKSNENENALASIINNTSNITNVSNDTPIVSISNIMDNVVQVSEYPGTYQLQTLSKQENENLTNWHMSGMQTVMFHDQIFRDDLIEDEMTPIKYSPNHRDEVTNYECSESEDGFSEVDQQEEFDGFKPLSETDEDENYEEENGFENENENEGIGNDEDDEIDEDNGHDDGHDEDDGNDDEHDFFVDENENTVIQMNNSKDEHVEERPITPGIKGNKSFEELVQHEIQREDQGQKQITSSTPVKPKARKFLKRGEGLKRFECGNYSKHRTTQKRKKKNETNEVGKPIESKLPGATRTTKGCKQQTKGILKNNSSSKVTHKNLLRNNERKNILHVIDEVNESPRDTVTRDTVTKIIHQRKAVHDNAIKMVVPEESRKVMFDNLIRKEVLNDFTITSSSFDTSFQNMLLQYKEKEERENKELDAFEALEEAAENVSLSSNSSVVIKYLGRRHPVSNDYQSTSKDEMPLIREDVASYGFDDETSWSDTSIISSESDENDGTVIRDPSPTEEPPLPHGTVIRDPSPTEEPPLPPKRIISKRKQEENKQNEDEDTKQVTPNPDEKEIIETNDDKLTLNSIYLSNNISDTVKKKLSELEKEISKFRIENTKLSELRTQRENDVKQLRKEIDTFQKEKTEELERIEDYRNEEMKKIKNERKLFDKYQKEIKAAPNKQEREELKELKAEVGKLKEELKNKEGKWNSASHRFRNRIVELEEENGELREEICVLEKQRLKRWKTSETSKVESCMKNKNNSENVNMVNGNKTDSSPSNSVSPVDCPYNITRGGNNITRLSLDKNYVEVNDEDIIRKESRLSEHHYHLPGNIGDNRNDDGNRKEIKHPDGKVEVILADLSRVITFPNGTKKTISKDEKTITVAFFNGDIKKILPNNKLVYYYAESRTTHTTFPDGQEMLEFPNNQVEKRYPDGKTEVIFPDHTVKYIYPDSTEETIFADGTVQKVNSQGIRTITFANGQKEIHTKEYKRREYPNGTVKTVYEDGRQETKYSTGRLRVKDRDGKLLLDSGPK